MKSVWKFPIPVLDRFHLEMPVGAEPICVQVQHDRPVLWALVNLDETVKAIRTFRFAGTGHEITDQIKAYVGTFQMADGRLVFHVFEVEP